MEQQGCDEPLSALPPYEYDPLPESGFIRLLTLYPPGPDGHVRCSLRMAELSQEMNNYTALSYVWGAPNPNQPIVLNGQRFNVRQNLYDFFCSRLGNEDTYWIDAICINQEAIDERNQQVAMMNRIYSGARIVYSWLGPSDEILDSLFDVIKCEIKRDEENLVEFYQEAKAKRTMLPTTSKTSFLDGVQHLKNNLYWTRMWIIPELLLAEDVVFWVGSRQAPLWSIRYLQLLTNPESPEMQADRALGALIYPREGQLISMIPQYGIFDCSIPHDRIYALCGVEQIRSTTTGPFPIRYEDDLPTLYARTMAHCRSSSLSFANSLAKALRLYSDQWALLPTLWQGDPETTLVQLRLEKQGAIGKRSTFDISGTKAYDVVGAAQPRGLTAVLLRDAHTTEPEDNVFNIGDLQGQSSYQVVAVASKSPLEGTQNNRQVTVQTAIFVYSVPDSQALPGGISIAHSLMMRDPQVWTQFWRCCNCWLAEEDDGKTVLIAETTIGHLLPFLKRQFDFDTDGDFVPRDAKGREAASRRL